MPTVRLGIKLMLSPGQFYKSVPKSLEENLLYRRYVVKQAMTDKSFRRGLEEACQLDFFFWLNTFGWQFNPDKREVGPFITWDRMPWLDDLPPQQTQEEAIREVLDAVEAREDVRWQKSREVGASWLVLFLIVWLCLFHENVAGLAMSRHEKAVDDPDDPDSLFWKVRFIHKHLPTWMTGPLKSKNKSLKSDSRPGIKEMANGFTYERTHSYFNGTANTKDAGVGGRKTIALIDEFGQFMNGHETYSMTSDTANCRVFVFTHRDNSGMAYNLCYDPKYMESMREIVTHWTQHPVKGRGCYRYSEERGAVDVLDKSYQFPVEFKFVLEARPTGGPFPAIRSPWYDKQCIRRTDRDVSMNLDIDPRGASEKVFDSYRISVLKGMFGREPTCWTLGYDKETGRPLELVPDPIGLIKLWCVPRGSLLMPKVRTGGGLDIATGSGATPSCLSIMSAATGQKLLEYSNANIYQNDLAVFVAAVCRMFVGPDDMTTLLGWEIQGGAAFDRKMREIGYGPCYVRRDEDSLGKERDNKGKRGINMSPPNIMAMMVDYRAGLYDQRCINPSVTALEQCLNFIYVSKGGSDSIEYQGPKKPGKVTPGSGARLHHGDVPKADAIAWKMVKELGFKEAEPEDGIDHDWIDPRTLEGRMHLAESQLETELVWR